MSFPPTKRVIYQNNPLVQVLCQLRFPTILRIDEERPVAFHEAIRQSFPYYNRVIGQAHGIELSDTIGSYSNTFISYTDSPNHTFTSQDGTWELNLTSNFITLSTTSYRKWEDFKGCFESLLITFMEVYKPSFFNRIGLRYVDAIDKTSLGLGECDWSALLNKAVIGMLDAEACVRQVTQCSQISELALDDLRHMVVRTGFGNVNGNTNFIIDTDIFTIQDTEYESVIASLDTLHQPVNDCFHWMISETLHNAMDPRNLED